MSLGFAAGGEAGALMCGPSLPEATDVAGVEADFMRGFLRGGCRGSASGSLPSAPACGTATAATLPAASLLPAAAALPAASPLPAAVALPAASLLPAPAAALGAASLLPAPAAALGAASLDVVERLRELLLGARPGAAERPTLDAAQSLLRGPQLAAAGGGSACGWAAQGHSI